MSRLLSSSPKLFTVEAANKMLPLVSAIASDLFPLWEAATSTKSRLKHLRNRRESSSSNPYSDELTAMEEKLEGDNSKVEALIDELRDLGVEFKGVASDQAHLCFPAMLEGRLVYLSWCPGELDVCHWIDFDGSFEARAPLVEWMAARE